MLNTVRTIAAILTAMILAGMFIFTTDTQTD